MGTVNVGICSGGAGGTGVPPVVDDWFEVK